MTNPKLRIVVLASAKESLNEIIQNIRKQSPQNAAIVKSAVIERIQKLSLFPRKFAVNPYAGSKENEYRSTTVKNILIVYRIVGNHIVVASILHGRSNPAKFGSFD